MKVGTKVKMKDSGMPQPNVTGVITAIVGRVADVEWSDGVHGAHVMERLEKAE